MKPKIPKGWHKIRCETVIRQGDKRRKDGRFVLSQLVGEKLSGMGIVLYGPYIRRNRRKAQKDSHIPNATTIGSVYDETVGKWMPVHCVHRRTRQRKQPKDANEHPCDTEGLENSN